MPSRLKDESQDVKGNRHIISAADVNKHDEEIRALERALGVRRPRFPASGFSGTATASGFSGSCLPSEQVSGQCPGEPPEDCSGVVMDVYQAMTDMTEHLSKLRDDYLLMTSGVVAVKDPSITGGGNGMIVWPTDWLVTTLSDPIPDDSVDLEEPLDDIDELELTDVDGLPDEGGYITIINDMSTIIFQTSTRNLRLLGYTSLATPNDPIYDQADIALDESIARKQRIFGLGTSVEILSYVEMDRPNKLLKGVSRKQLASTSTRHAIGDLVFKGRMSISVGPINYRLTSTTTDQIDCFLRSNGKISLANRNFDFGVIDPVNDSTVMGYAHYSAIMLRDIGQIPPFQPGNFGNCQEVS
jgi:hypothetical protein